MSFINRLAVGLAMAAALTACGGGGGNPGTSSGGGTVLPLKLAAPSSVTIAPGAAAVYGISGGQTPYTTASDNPNIVKAAVDQNSGLTVGGVLEGVAKVQVYDAKLNSVEITVNVSAGPAVGLFTTAPSPLNMAPSTKQSFSIGGGKAPYIVFSDKVSVATAIVNGTALEITAIAVGTANVKITDALGAPVNVAVTVASTAGVLAVTPDTASAYVNTVVEVAITGGIPPYRVAGGILSAAQTSINGSTLTITPLLVSSGLDISILDSQNQTAKFTLTVIAGQPTIRLSPNALTVSERQTQSIALTVFGATGEVKAFSSDLTLFTTAVNGNAITVNQIARCVGTDTSVTITVVDASRALATSVITVKDNGNIAAVVGPPAVPGSDCPP